MKIAIIGAGISGMTVGRLIGENADVTIFEKDSRPGGLIKCQRINGSLFHTCGGHVFNSKKQNVLEWFWRFFDKENEFTKTDRNSVIFMDSENGSHDAIPYPIENYAYLLNKDTQKAFINDLLTLSNTETGGATITNFEEFLKSRFGNTLYNIYFQPYNEKVWRRDLKNVPLTWLEGKLPMPTVEEMIYNNFNHVQEKAFVHSSFWYEKNNGSQYLADKFAEGLNIRYNSNISSISYLNGKWIVNNEEYDKVVFCGNIKNMVAMIDGIDLTKYQRPVEALEYHGTTAVFCEIDRNPYSWIYQPSRNHESHRIICTGNFAESNNSPEISKDRITATIEFTDEINKEEILLNLKKIPLHPHYITHKYNKYTYPIQDANTRDMIKELKSLLASTNMFFTGRFADWEYYNMDVAIEAAMNVCKQIKYTR